MRPCRIERRPTMHGESFAAWALLVMPHFASPSESDPSFPVVLDRAMLM